MSVVPPAVMPPATSPAMGASAYAQAARGAVPSAGQDTAAGGFSAAIGRALEGAINTGHKADSEAMRAIAGGGNLTDVVTALSHAELTLQTATVIRDRVVQAYQDIMKMPI